MTRTRPLHEGDEYTKRARIVGNDRKRQEMKDITGNALKARALMKRNETPEMAGRATKDENENA